MASSLIEPVPFPIIQNAETESTETESRAANQGETKPSLEHALSNNYTTPLLCSESCYHGIGSPVMA